MKDTRFSALNMLKISVQHDSVNWEGRESGRPEGKHGGEGGGWREPGRQEGRQEGQPPLAGGKGGHSNVLCNAFIANGIIRLLRKDVPMHFYLPLFSASSNRRDEWPDLGLPEGRRANHAPPLPRPGQSPPCFPDEPRAFVVLVLHTLAGGKAPSSTSTPPPPLPLPAATVAAPAGASVPLCPPSLISAAPPASVQQLNSRHKNYVQKIQILSSCPSRLQNKKIRERNKNEVIRSPPDDEENYAVWRN